MESQYDPVILVPLRIQPKCFGLLESFWLASGIICISLRSHW